MGEPELPGGDAAKGNASQAGPVRQLQAGTVAGRQQRAVPAGQSAVHNELRKDLAGISQKVLTDSLREMEAAGIVTRTAYPEVPPRVEYALSELGETLGPILDAIAEWGTDYKKQL